MGRALIINDNPSITRVISEIFENMAWQVFTAMSREAAPDACTACRPDLVLADVDMRGGAGFEAMSDIRRFNRHLYIIAATRGGHADLRRQVALACGADYYIAGPVSAGKLREAIEHWLRRDEPGSTTNLGNI